MQIETLEKIRVPAGVRLLLDSEQLDARRHNVAIDEDGVALVVRPMEFKAGEVLEVVGDLPIVIQPAQYKVLDGGDAEKPAKAPKAPKSKPPKASKEPADSDADKAGDKNDADGANDANSGDDASGADETGED